ncbi:MAG: hypothetical protein ACI4O7_13805 [Aristaeellaceae bacterium]
MDDEYSLRAHAFANWNGTALSCFVQESESGWLEASPWRDPDTNMLVSEYVVNSDSQYYTVVDGVLYSKDMSQLLLYPPMKDCWYFQVPSCVREISDVAFMGSYYLRDLVITDSVTGFGEDAGCDLFYESCVEVVYFPDSLEQGIDIDAFAYMPCIREIVVPADSLIGRSLMEADHSGYLNYVSAGIVRFY